MGAAIITGTGFEGRARIIRKRCKNGQPVSLIREPSNPYDPNAIGVYIKTHIFLGIGKCQLKIGYIKKERAIALAKRLDSGETIDARITSFHAPNGREHPRVSIGWD